MYVCIRSPSNTGNAQICGSVIHVGVLVFQEHVVTTASCVVPNAAFMKGGRRCDREYSRTRVFRSTDLECKYILFSSTETGSDHCAMTSKRTLRPHVTVALEHRRILYLLFS